MEDIYGPLLFEEDLSPKQRAALREHFEENPDVAEGCAHWREVRARLRDRLQKRLPDRRLLVLYALEQEGQGEALTPDENAALDAARADIASAIKAIPALERVVERIQEERADFETVWNQHRGEASAGAPSTERRPAAEREERAPRRPSQAREEGTLRRWTWRLTVAVLLVGAAALAVLYGPRRDSRTTVTVGTDAQRIVEFDDGSTARLIGAASMSYDPDGAATESRHVTLERGRAYFDVVSHEDASFAVTTPTASTLVLGTQFGVTTGEDTTEVVVAEGQVQVGSVEEEGKPVVLESGERSLVRRAQPPSAPTPVDLTAALEWTGLFVFRSTSIKTVAQRLSRHHDVSITVAPTLADEAVTGTFEREQSISQVLDALALALGAEVQTQNGTYRLEPAP